MSQTPTLEDMTRAGLSGYRQGATLRAAGRAYPETIARSRSRVRELRNEVSTYAAQERGYLRGLISA